MAQIKKLQPGGSVTTQDPEKTYGKVFKNGTPYDVHEDTLKWLEGLGAIGMEMASELRKGEDQHIEVGADGVGVIRNVSSGVSGMNYRQRRRLSRKPGIFGGIFEDPSTKMTREIIQGITNKNYTDFKDTRAIYDMPTIDLDISASLDADNSPVYTFTTTSINNDKAIQWLNDIIKNGGIVIPKGHKWNGDYAELEKLNTFIKTNMNAIKELPDKLKGVGSKKIGADDIALLKSLGINYSLPTTVGDKKIEDIQTDNKRNAAKQYIADRLGIAITDPILNEFTYNVDENDYVSVNASKNIIDELTQNHIFSKYDNPKYHPLIGQVLYKGELVDINDLGSQYFDKEYFTSLLKSYDFEGAQKIMHFNMPTGVSSKKIDWNYLDSNLIVPGLDNNTIYFKLNDNTAISLNFDNSDHPLLPKFIQHNLLTQTTGDVPKNPLNPPLNPSQPSVSAFQIKEYGGKKGVVWRIEKDGKGSSLFFVPSENKIYVIDSDKLTNSLDVKFDDNLTDSQKLDKLKLVPSNLQKYVESNGLPGRKEGQKGMGVWLLNLIKNGTVSINRRGGLLEIQKLQGGGGITFGEVANEKSQKEQEVKSDDYNPAEKPLKAGEVFDGDMTLYDWAEVGAFISDLASYGMSYGGEKFKIPSLVTGYLSDLMWGVSSLRDGFQLKDVVDTAMQAGITSQQYRWNNKSMRVISNILAAAGAVQGGIAFKNIIDTLSDPNKSWRDISTADINNAFGGIKFAISKIRDGLDVRKAAKFTTTGDELQTRPKNNNDVLSRFTTEQQSKIKINSVDDVMSRTDIDLSEAKQQGWFNTTNKKIKNYDIAYNWLREKGIITDDVLIRNSSGMSSSVGTRAKEHLEQRKNDVIKRGKDLVNTVFGLSPAEHTLRTDLSNDVYLELLNNNKRWIENFLYKNPQNKAILERIKEDYVQNPDGKWVKKTNTNVREENSTPKPETPKNNDTEPSTRTSNTEAPTITSRTQTDLPPMENLFNLTTGKHNNRQFEVPKNLAALEIDAARQNNGLYAGKKFLEFKTFTNPKNRMEKVSRIIMHDPGSLRVWGVYDETGALLGATTDPNKGISEYDYVGYKNTNTGSKFGQDNTYTPYVDIDVNQVSRRKRGGVLKAYFGNKIEKLFDQLSYENKNLNDKAVYEKIYNEYGDKLRPGRKSQLANALNTKTYWTDDGKFNHEAFYGQRVANSKNIFGVTAPIIEYGITAIGNQKVKDKETEAIRTRSIGEMQSMPIKKPHVSTNLNPLHKQYDDQKTELWGHTMNVNNTLSDARAKLANLNNTMSKLNTGEKDLLGQVSKQLASDDAQNVNLDWAYDAEVRRIADANDKVSANTKTSILEKEADYIGTKFDNATKFIAELRDNENKFHAVRRNQQLYNQIQRLRVDYSELSTDEKNGEKGKALLSQITSLTKLLDSGTVYSRLTGNYGLQS